MELFSVICTTCHSKLKVRERAAIGQILACPKCQAMVLIEPPAGWSDPGDGAQAAPAALAATTTATTAPLRRDLAAAASPSSSTFEDAAALLSEPAHAPAPPLATATVAQNLPLAPGAEWISPQTQLMRRWLLIGGLSTIGAVVLIGALVYAISGDEPAVATATETPEPAPPPPSTPPKDDVDDPQEPEVADGLEMNEPDDSPAPVDPTVEDAPRELPQPESKPAETTPPDFSAEEPANDIEPMSAAPKPLNIFGDLIEEKPFQAQPTVEPADTEPAMPPVTSEEQTPSSIDEPLPRPAPRKVDVARRLADPIEAIELSNLPLADFVQLITDMTAVPVTLDPIALPAIKVSPATKVSVNLKATNVGDLLTAALRPHGLAYVASATQVVIVPAASTKAELREIKHDVSDLAKTAEAATVLAEAIHACVDPASWDDAGGRGTLAVEGTSIVMTQSPEVHFSTVVLCEKLRLARKLPTRSAYPASVLTLTPRAVVADAILDTPVTMNFVPPTRIGRVAEHIERTTGMRLLVDWRALAEIGWTPEAEVKAGVAGQPLSAFLDQLARRMEVSWRVIDATTIQLTTPAGLTAAADVEVYLVEADDSAALVARLQKELGSELFVPGGPAALRYDEQGRCLIARLPQPLQRKLIAILAKLG